MQFLRTLSDEIWQEYEKELLNKLNQFCHKQAFIWSDGLFEDDIPF